MKIAIDNDAPMSFHAPASNKKQKVDEDEFFYDDLPKNITAHFKDIESDIRKYKIFMSDNKIYIRRKKKKKEMMNLITFKKYQILRSKFCSTFRMKNSQSNY